MTTDLQCLGETHTLTDLLFGAFTLLLQYIQSCNAILPGSTILPDSRFRINRRPSSFFCIGIYLVWIPLNLHPVSQANNQNSNLRNKTMLVLCVTCASNFYPVSRAQSTKTVISATNLCWIRVIPARVIPLLHFKQRIL